MVKETKANGTYDWSGFWIVGLGPRDEGPQLVGGAHESCFIRRIELLLYVSEYLLIPSLEIIIRASLRHARRKAVTWRTL